MRTVELQVLGPVALTIDGQRTLVAAAKPRSLLGLLLLEVNRVASRDWLIDQLWNGVPPKAATSTLRAYIYQLRQRLEFDDSAVALRSRDGGYVLEAEPGIVDAHRFEALAAQGRQDGRVMASGAQLPDEVIRARLNATAELRIIAGTAGKQNPHRRSSFLACPVPRR
jgi:DNA-binding SARP family transcriptional activator